MIINIFLTLIAVSVLSNFFVKSSYDKIAAFLVCTIFTVLFFNFYETWQLKQDFPFVYHWLKYRTLNVDVNLSSTNQNYGMIFPIFIVSLCSMLIAVFNKNEVFKAKLSSHILLNLAFFILLICSNNLIQLLISSSMVGVIGFYIINDVQAREKYVFYNLLADLGLFSVFAIIYGQLGNLDLSELGRYEKEGAHSDLVAILLLMSIYIKSGLFLFQNQLLNLSSVNFNRINLISWVSTPLAGVIILSKTMPLLSISEFSLPFLQIFAVLTMAWAFFASLIIDNIKERSIYLNLMIYGYVFALISLGDFSVSEHLPTIVLVGYLLSMGIYMVYISSSNELSISRMGGFFKALKLTFTVSLLSLLLFVQTILHFTTEFNHLWSLSLLTFVVLSAGHFYHQVYFGADKADDRVVALLKNPSWYVVIPQLLMIYFLASYNNYYTPEILYVGATLVLLMFTDPFCQLERLAEYEAIQEEDYFEKAYDLLILTPVKILGRILWLLVDFILIERTIISSLTNGTNFLIRISSKLHSCTLFSGILFTALGLSAMILYYFIKG